MSDFSRGLTTTRGQISEADLETFLAAGFTAAQALEVVVGGAVSLLANYTNHLAHAPLDEFLQPQAWKALAQSAIDGSGVVSTISDAVDNAVCLRQSSVERLAIQDIDVAAFTAGPADTTRSGLSLKRLTTWFGLIGTNIEALAGRPALRRTSLNADSTIWSDSRVIGATMVRSLMYGIWLEV